MVRSPPKALLLGMSLMPDIFADAPDASCSLLLFESGILESQSLALDPSPPRECGRAIARTRARVDTGLLRVSAR